jgi:hypothetical protein
MLAETFQPVHLNTHDKVMVVNPPAQRYNNS